jgi:hypothetical protein
MLVGQSALAATAYVPVRVSVKFILSSTGSRPATGRLNTDEEIEAEWDWGNTILADERNMSEFRLYKRDFIVDLSGVSSYYSATANSTNRDNLRADAMASPGTYLWRTNAINIYINGGTGSAISKFPPDNDIILMNQNCGNTPSCMLHELGHSLNLLHTHQSGGDGCSDTVGDNSSWTKNQIAQNAFGKNYDDCTASEKDQVDLVYNNVMSYHTSEPQLRFSACQLDRVSTQGDSDRAWLLYRQPVYVDSGYGGAWEFGRFTMPFKTIQAAITGGITNSTVVLQDGTYADPTDVIDDSSYMVTRSGTSTVQGCLLFTLPTDLENSKNPQVSNAIKAVQSADNAARRVVREAQEAASNVVTTIEAGTDEADPQIASIMANAEEAKRLHEESAIGHLLEAEMFATGREKIAIQLELAERYKYSGDCTEAIGYFILVADNTTQPHLRTRALYEANHCQELLDMSLGADAPGPDQPAEEDITPVAPEQVAGKEKSEVGKVREKQFGPEDMVPEE